MRSSGDQSGLWDRATVLYLVAIAGSVAFLLAGSVMHALWPDWRWHHEPLHSTIEAVGGLAAIAMAAMLSYRPQHDAAGGKYRALAGGFLGMGILEEFHAIVAPGNAFVLFRNLASLVGGIAFLSVFRTRTRGDASIQRWEPWLIAAGALSVGMWFLMVPDQIPDMIRNGTFTPVAVAPQSVACLCFLLVAARFLLDYWDSRMAEDILFASLALLFGLAEFVFVYSIPWDNRWWFWHGLRLIACLLTLGYISRSYFQVATGLEQALVEAIRSKETLSRSEQQLRTMLGERARMARDLHDSTIQSLFATRLSIERSQRLASAHYQELAAQLGMAAASLKTVIGDLRGYILGLEPVRPDGPALEAALASLVEDMNQVPSHHFHLQVEAGLAKRLTDEQAAQLLPIAQEAISNSLQHSAARTGRLTLQSEDGIVRLIVEDDGFGFDVASVQQRGHGLNNMETRATMLGGRLEIKAHPGQGTRVVCTFPLRLPDQGRSDAAS
jgi:signal transduction histidine kinase